MSTVFGNNLKALISRKGSVSAVCRDLGSHRSQVNRFLAGTGFPKPDTLRKICRHFDARSLGKKRNQRQEQQFKGAVFGNGLGVVVMSAHQKANACSFNYLREAMFTGWRFLAGYSARMMPEIATSQPVCHVVYERMPQKRVLSEYRKIGLKRRQDIPAHYQPYLGKLL
jgi:hypothetical protein